MEKKYNLRRERGRRLKDARGRAGLTAGELAYQISYATRGRINCTASCIYAWEHGRNLLRDHIATVIAPILCCSLDDLLGQYRAEELKTELQKAQHSEAWRAHERMTQKRATLLRKRFPSLSPEDRKRAQEHAYRVLVEFKEACTAKDRAKMVDAAYALWWEREFIAHSMIRSELSDDEYHFLREKWEDAEDLLILERILAYE